MYGRCYLSCAWNFGCTPFPFSFLLNLNISISLNGANVPTYLMGIYNVSSSIVAVTSGRNCMFLGSLRHYGSAYGIAPVFFLLWIRGIDDSTLWRERCGSTTMSMRKTKDLNSKFLLGVVTNFYGHCDPYIIMLYGPMVKHTSGTAGSCEWRYKSLVYYLSFQNKYIIL